MSQSFFTVREKNISDLAHARLQRSNATLRLYFQTINKIVLMSSHTARVILRPFFSNP